MLHKLLATAANNAKLALAAVAGAALVAGGSAVAIQQVSDDTSGTPSVTSSQSVDNDNEAAEHRSDTSTATIPTPKASKSPKPAKSPEADGDQGVHGACVSAVAHDKSKVGREHGKAVSAAAHSCPKGAEADATAETEHSDATAETEPSDAADDGDTTSKPAHDSHGRSGEHKPGS